VFYSFFSFLHDFTSFGGRPFFCPLRHCGRPLQGPRRYANRLPITQFSTPDTSPHYLVHKSASDRDIRAAYKRLSKKYHPDKNKAPDAEDKFVEIARGSLKSFLAYIPHHELMLLPAYEVLSDPTVSTLLTSALTQL